MISRSQLFCILLLSRLSAEIALPYSGDFSGAGLLALITAEALRFVLALPILLYSIRGSSLYGAIGGKSRFLGELSGFLAAALLAFLAVRTMFYTAEFAQRTLLGGMSGAVILVMLAVFAVYTAVKGAEALSRAGVLFLAAAGIVTIAVILADIPHIRMREAAGTEYGRLFVRQVVERLFGGGEYLVLAALLPYVKPRENKHGCGGTGLLFALSSVAGAVLLNLFCMGVLGEFYAVAEYPFIAASQLSDIALFKRLDGFAGAVWSLAAALRGALMLFCAYASIREVLPKKNRQEERSAA